MGEIILYTTDDGLTKLNVQLEDETVWLTQDQMTSLFGKTKSTISEHIKHIFEEGELEEKSVVRKSRTTAADGKNYAVNYYNLDVIISVGYRVKSIQGTRFRQWATQRLKEYIVKGFTMDDERLKGSGGGQYWKELLDRIRDIRSSEKVIYRQVLDLYATSVDYDPKSQATIQFFKIVQNKLHYATNELTAPEVIHIRADSTKEFMGLTTFKGAMPTLNEAKIAKNYLTEDEMFRLNRLVSAFFDLAELRAKEQTPMYMQNWIDELDRFSQIYGKGVLQDTGTVSRKQADQKATQEYRTYTERVLSPIEKEYLEHLKSVEKKGNKG